jgi:hypothetical protein
MSGQAAARYVRGVHYSSARVGGDDPELSPEQVQAWHRKVGAPDNELPGAIPFHAVLAKTDDLAVAVVGADAYSTGMSIKIAIRLRRSDPSRHGLDAPHTDRAAVRSSWALPTRMVGPPAT